MTSFLLKVRLKKAAGQLTQAGVLARTVQNAQRTATLRPHHQTDTHIWDGCLGPRLCPAFLSREPVKLRPAAASMILKVANRAMMSPRFMACLPVGNREIASPMSPSCRHRDDVAD